MASETNSDPSVRKASTPPPPPPSPPFRPPLQKKKKTLNKRLRDTTVVIYNFVKAKPIGSRSANEQILFQQACLVTEYFSTSD